MFVEMIVQAGDDEVTGDVKVPDELAEILNASGAARMHRQVMWSAPRRTRNSTVPPKEPPVASIGSRT